MTEADVDRMYRGVFWTVVLPVGVLGWLYHFLRKDPK